MKRDIWYKATNLIIKSGKLPNPAYHCPTGAMKLIKTDLREVLIPPPKLEIG